MKRTIAFFLLCVCFGFKAQVPDVRDHFKTAYDLYEQKKYNECVVEYSNYLASHPDDGAAYYNRALAKYLLKDYKDAMSDYSASIQKGRDKYDAYYGRGLCSFFLAQYEEALKDLDKSISMKSDYAKAHTYKAASLYYLKKYNEAMPVINKAVELDPQFEWSFYLKIKYSNNDLKGSLEDANKGVELKPSKDFYFQRGFILLEAKKYNECIPDFDSVIFNSQKKPTPITIAAWRVLIWDNTQRHWRILINPLRPIPQRPTAIITVDYVNSTPENTRTLLRILTPLLILHPNSTKLILSEPPVIFI